MLVSYNHPPTESGIFRSSGPAKPGNRAIKPKYSTYRAKTAGSSGRISITNISSNDANSDDSRVPPHLNRQKVNNSQSTIYNDTSERRNQSRSDGNMYNILLGGEFPNGDNHSPERRTTAENIKYFIEIPKKYLKAHSFELMGFSPEEVPVNDHDPVQNRLDNERFVKRQARLGYDKKQFSFLKKQIDKIISSSENATILGKELNLLPSNSNTLKMNVKNDTNIPDATMTDAIRNIGWKTLPNCVKQLREKKTEIDYIKSVRFIDGNFKNAREPGPGTDLREEAEHYFNVLLELDELILQVIICIIIGNARVFGKAHFVNAREGRILHLIKNSVLDGILDGYNAPTLQRVEGNILEIFDKKQIQIENEPARFFELQEVPVTAGRFLWARVYYRKGKALKKAAKHYKMYFLQPADELTLFEESGSLSIDGRQFIVANAIVDVALKKVPNKYAIASVLLTNLEYYGEKAICDNPQPETDAIRFYSQHSKETAAELARYEDENFKDCYASKLEKLKGMRPNKQLTDFTEMTSVVKFCHQYCNICHSTEHSLTNCEKKGCKLCLNKNHLVWKCTNRCKCGKGAHHLKKNCPSKKGNSKKDEKLREFATAALGEELGANDESPTTGQTQVSQQTNVAHETTHVTAQNENDPIVSKRHASLRNLSEDSQRLEDVITPQAPKVITGDEPEGKKRKDNNHQEASSSVSEETQYVETQKDTESESSKDQSFNTQHTDPEESNISYQETQANTAPSAFLASIASRVKYATPAVSVLCPVTINSQGAFIPNLNSSEEIPSSLNRLLFATVDNHHPSPPGFLGY